MARTILERLDETAQSHADRPALRVKEGGEWQETSWREYRQQVRQAARGFIRLGVEPGHGVAIMGYNRPEWFIADIAAIAAGGVPAGIYTSLTPEQCQYIAHHAEASVAVLEDESYLEKFRTIRDQLPALKAIVLMRGSAGDEGVYSWAELLEMGDEVAESDLETRIAAQKPDDLCTLIYTSGTTGPPKAVMISHSNILWVADSVANAYSVHAGDAVLSYLPLSHIAEQVVSLHVPMNKGACSWFAESLEKLGENLREVRPHFFFAVPRVWEKMQAAIQAAGAQNSGLKKRIATWARGVGLRAGRREQAGQGRPVTFGLANALVFSKVREKLGLDRAGVCATSTAPIGMDTLEFFLSLGVPILEVYGMSECTGPATQSTPDRYRLGTVGYTIPGTEISIAEDGEILMRGPHIFLGYYKNEAATEETKDGEGWLHSGDIGEVDGDGFLRITDRKKDLIITSGGKNIGPQILEAHFKTIPVVSQVVVIGDRRKFVSALVTLDPEKVAAEAKAAGSPATDSASAADCPIFKEHLAKQIEAVNATLARYETVKKFAILPREFSMEEGELTPTMKIKRRVIQERYADIIEDFYR